MRALFAILTLMSAQSLLAQKQWSQFRGPHGNGHVITSVLPAKWSEDQNVTWKTPIHDRGWSSPVIWDNQVWVTTATMDGRKMFAVCLDKTTGKIVHDLHIFDVQNPQKISTENSYATPTPVIDEKRVYLHFGTYGTACLDRLSGKVLWTRRDLNCDHEAGAGPASSPMLVGDRFVVNVDGRDFQYVIALHTTTGKTVWKAKRSADLSQVPVNKRKAYSMPILAPYGDEFQLISNGAQAIYAYDPSNGNELWRCRHHGFSNAPRPVYRNGVVYTTVDRDNPELWAIRADGKNDVTNSNVIWKEKKSMPPRCSPLLYDNLLLLVNRKGIATCLEAKTGKLVWRERLKGAYSASPIMANGRIYLFNEEAGCTIIKPGRKLEVVAVNRLDKDILVATPAVSDGAIFVRTEKHLYRIESKSK